MARWAEVVTKAALRAFVVELAEAARAEARSAEDERRWGHARGLADAVLKLSATFGLEAAGAVESGATVMNLCDKCRQATCRCVSCGRRTCEREEGT
jgi:hypothetical protein